MPAPESSVLVRLRLLGAQAFARDANRDAAAMRRMGESATAAGAATARAGKAFGVAGSAIAGAGRLIRRASLPVVALGVVSGKMAMDFQQSMLLIHTQAGASMGEVHKLSNSVLELAKIEPQSPKQLADALYRLEGAGLRGAKAMTGLKAAADLAAVGNANVEDTAKTLSQVWFSGIKGASNLRTVVAEMNATVGAGDMRLQQLVDALGTGIMPVARNAGLTMRDVTGALALFGDETTNVSGWTAQLATALHYLYAPGSKAQGAMAGIGLSGKQLGKDFRSKNGLLTALRDLRGHLDKLPGGFRGIKASQTLAEILPGGRGRVLNVMLGQLDRYRGKLIQIGGTTNRFGEAVARTHETAAFKVKAAWSTIQAALIRLGSHLLPLAGAAFGGVAKAVDFLSGRMEALANGPGGKGISKLFSALVHGAPKPPEAKPPVMPRRVIRDDQGRVQRVVTAQRVIHRGPGGRVEHVDSAQAGQQYVPPPTGMAKAGLAIRGALAPVIGWAKKELPVVGKAFVTAGKQLVDAFKPAMPFVTNVLLPLLKGIGIGIIASVVGAFKVLVPMIKIAAVALGFLGKIMAPFKGLITGIGVVIGFLAGGPILKLFEGLGKIGIVFRLLGAPIRFATAGFKLYVGIVGRVVGILLRVDTAIARFIGTFATAPARAITSARNLVVGIMRTIGSLGSKAVAVGGRFVSGIANGVRSRLGSIAAFFGRVGKAIISAIVNAIKGAAGQVAGAVMSVVPGPAKKIVKKALHLLPGAATGGTIKRGGMAVVGERGPELAQLPTGTTIYSNRASRRASAPMMQAPIFLTANLHLSGKQIHSEVFRVDRQQAEVS